MRAYLAQLQRQVGQTADAERITADNVTAPKTVKPLDQQITELMRSLPPALRNRPWAIHDLVNRLEGRYQDRPHAQGVGQALRRLGWQRIRPENSEGQGRRMWLPPIPPTCGAN